MATKPWHPKILTMIKQLPGLTARQVHQKLGLRSVYYPEVGHVLRGMERAGLVESREEVTGDRLRERSWWPV